MSRDLPQGWTQATLAQVTQKISMRQPRPEEDFVYIDISSINRDFKKIENPQSLTGDNAPSRARQVVAQGDTLVSMTRPNLNAVALVPAWLDGQIASTGFNILRAQTGIDHRWLFYITRTTQFVSSMSEIVQGALYPAIRPKDIGNYVIPLAPLNEQKRIADKLDVLLGRVDASKERLERVPALLKRIRQSLLAMATSGTLTEAWREKTQVASEFNRPVKLKNTGTTFSYGSSAKSSLTGETPVLRMGNIQNGKLDWSDLVYTSNKEEIEKYALFKGDVLFNRTNSPELVGKTAVYEGEQQAIYAGYLIRVKCGPKILPNYLNYCLNSPAGRDYCWSVKSDGVSQSNINAKKLGDFEFFCPPVLEQKEIIKKVQNLLCILDMLEASLCRTEKKLEQLKQSILTKAFSGKLTQQDSISELDYTVLIRTEENRSQPMVGATRSKVTNERKSKVKLEFKEVLKKFDRGLEPNKLLEASGYDLRDIEEFYRTLDSDIKSGKVQERRSGDGKVLLLRG